MPLVEVWQSAPDGVHETHINDRSSLDAITRQLPDGFYSTFRTFGGCTRVLGLDAHLLRLYEPVAAPEVDVDSLRRQLRTLLERYRPGEARIRLVMTREGQAFIAIEPLKLLPPEVYRNGVRVETTGIQRQDPRLKSTSFIDRSDSERKHIAQEGIFEALLVKDGNILEGMTSNFFYVKSLGAERSEQRPLRRIQSKLSQRGDILCTAQDDILFGITRETVLAIAQGRGLPSRFEPLRRDQVETVDEAFITSSSRGIAPVVQIDNSPVGQGRPGPVTKELMAAYETYVLEHAEAI